MDWIPAISTTSLLAFILWLCRKLIAIRLTNAVKHEYDKKIENIKTTLRQSEESFKAELKSKESQIDALRSGALSGVVNKQAILYERQVKAIEQLWNAVISLTPGKNISEALLAIKFDKAVKITADNPQFREVFSALGANFELKDIKYHTAYETRPFISPLSWALYVAYQAIVSDAVLKLHMLKNGIDMVEIINTEAVTKLVKVALPHQTEYVEKYGPSAFHFLLEELENKLLLEFTNMLKGIQSDKETIDRAALIVKESERLMEANASLSKGE